MSCFSCSPSEARIALGWALVSPSPVRLSKKAAARFTFAISRGWDASLPSICLDSRRDLSTPAAVPDRGSARALHPRGVDCPRRVLDGPQGRRVRRLLADSVATLVAGGRRCYDGARDRPLMLIDYSSLLYRAFHSLPDTLPMHGVLRLPQHAGAARSATTARPGLAIAVDDDWRPAFRVDALPSYKAHRVAERGRGGSGGAAGGGRARGARARSASRSSAPRASRPRT